MPAVCLASDSFLICRSDLQLCALPLEYVAETMRALPIDAVPAMPSFLLGVSIIRGGVTPVVHVAKLIGSMADTLPSRFVTVRVGERQVAFAVDSVIGVRSLNPESIERIPLLLHEADASSVAAITTLDAELLLVLQSARLLPESVWEALDGQVAQA